MGEFGKLRVNGSFVEQEGGGSSAPFRLENCTPAEEKRLVDCWNEHEALVARVAQLESSLGHAVFDEGRFRDALREIISESEPFDPATDSGEDFAQWVCDIARAALKGGE